MLLMAVKQAFQGQETVFPILPFQTFPETYKKNTKRKKKRYWIGSPAGFALAQALWGHRASCRLAFLSRTASVFLIHKIWVLQLGLELSGKAFAQLMRSPGRA